MGKCIFFEFVTEKIKMIERFPKIHNFFLSTQHIAMDNKLDIIQKRT